MSGHTHRVKPNQITGMLTPSLEWGSITIGPFFVANTDGTCEGPCADPNCPEKLVREAYDHAMHGGPGGKPLSKFFFGQYMRRRLTEIFSLSKSSAAGKRAGSTEAAQLTPGKERRASQAGHALPAPNAAEDKTPSVGKAVREGPTGDHRGG